MSLDTQLLLDAINKLFDKVDARWDARWAKEDVAREATRGVPVPTQSAAVETDVVADNWGGLFDGDHASDEQLYEVRVVADNGCGLFEQPAHFQEEPDLEFPDTPACVAPAPVVVHAPASCLTSTDPDVPAYIALVAAVFPIDAGWKLLQCGPVDTTTTSLPTHSPATSSPTPVGRGADEDDTASTTLKRCSSDYLNNDIAELKPICVAPASTLNDSPAWCSMQVHSSVTTVMPLPASAQYSFHIGQVNSEFIYIGSSVPLRSEALLQLATKIPEGSVVLVGMTSQCLVMPWLLFASVLDKGPWPPPLKFKNKLLSDTIKSYFSLGLSFLYGQDVVKQRPPWPPPVICYQTFPTGTAQPCLRSWQFFIWGLADGQLRQPWPPPMQIECISGECLERWLDFGSIRKHAIALVQLTQVYFFFFSEACKWNSRWLRATFLLCPSCAVHCAYCKHNKEDMDIVMWITGKIAWPFAELVCWSSNVGAAMIVITGAHMLRCLSAFCSAVPVIMISYELCLLILSVANSKSILVDQGILYLAYFSTDSAQGYCSSSLELELFQCLSSLYRLQSLLSADGIVKWPQTQILTVEITIPLTFTVGESMRRHLLQVVVLQWLAEWCQFVVAKVSGQIVGVPYLPSHQLSRILAVQQLFLWDPGGDQYVFAQLEYITILYDPWLLAAMSLDFRWSSGLHLSPQFSVPQNSWHGIFVISALSFHMFWLANFILHIHKSSSKWLQSSHGYIFEVDTSMSKVTWIVNILHILTVRRTMLSVVVYWFLLVRCGCNTKVQLVFQCYLSTHSAHDYWSFSWLLALLIVPNQLAHKLRKLIAILLRNETFILVGVSRKSRCGSAAILPNYLACYKHG